MKKMFVFLFVLMSCVVSFAQSLEVRGVETKLVVYDGPEYVSDNNRNNRIEWFGFSFYNMNKGCVSVEAELYKRYEKENTTYVRIEETILVDTKTFTLEANQTYIWKQEHNAHFHAYDADDKKYPRSSDGSYALGYYVKYKAYKME